MSHSYQDFEPEFQYQKGEDHDIIEFQVRDFRKDQLKVHISSKGVLTVSGERPHEGNKRIRFRKDINPPKDCNLNDIRAKLTSGVLFLTIPKEFVPQVQRGPSSENQENGKLKREGSSSKEAMTSPNEDAALQKTETKSFMTRLKTERKTSMKVVAGVAVLSLLFTVLFYVYKMYGPVIMHGEKH